MAKLSLHKKYQEKIKKELILKFKIKNQMAVPKLEKIVVNMGTGDALRKKETAAKLTEDLTKITGQKPETRPAKISVAGFGIRAGMPVGLKVTLHGERMYDFFEKLVGVVLPRLRDFRGVPLKSFDKTANYTLGLQEHTVFPEIDLNQTPVARGLEITFVSNTKDQKQAKKLLELLGMPFERKEK